MNKGLYFVNWVISWRERLLTECSQAHVLCSLSFKSVSEKHKLPPPLSHSYPRGKDWLIRLVKEQFIGSETSLDLRCACKLEAMGHESALVLISHAHHHPSSWTKPSAQVALLSLSSLSELSDGWEGSINVLYKKLVPILCKHPPPVLLCLRTETREGVLESPILPWNGSCYRFTLSNSQDTINFNLILCLLSIMEGSPTRDASDKAASYH